MPIEGLTPEEVAARTFEQVQGSVKSTSRSAKLKGETSAEANARLTEAYKTLQAKPILSEEMSTAGAQVQWTRQAAGGIGEYVVVVPPGYDGPKITKTFGPGIIRPDLVRTKVTTAGVTPGTIVPTGVKTPTGATVTSPTSVVAPTKTVVSKKVNGDGTTTVTYSDTTTSTVSSTAIIDTPGVVEDTVGKPTTNIDVLKSYLKSEGFSAAILDASTSFLNSLLKEGLDYDNATEIFLNQKEYTLKNGTKINSPFYTEYGYLNEGLIVPKSANELFNTVEGFKGVIDKYKLSQKYLTPDNMKKYVKNDVTVTDLAQRAATAQLKAIEADPFQVDALIKQGYIGSQMDLTDFYMDPKIGKEQLEINRQTGLFTAEALRRAKSGVVTSASQLARFKQLSAGLTSQGYSDEQIAKLAGASFENIAQDIQPLTLLSQRYEKTGGTVAANASLAEELQTGLLEEEFKGTASERRKRLREQEIRSFQGSAGTTQGSLRQANVLGIL